MPSYRLHGLTVDTDLPLQAELAPAGSVADVVLERVDELGPCSAVAELVLSYEGDDRTWVRANRCEGGEVIVDLSGVLTCRLESYATRVRAVLRDEALGQLLVEGWLIAFVLSLRGHLVLHASAVTLSEGRTVAFVGPSGMGKSTLATLLCAEQGATFLTDDVARVDVMDRVAMIHRGGKHARLRSKAHSLAELIDRPTTRTSDGRLALGLPQDGDDPRPLDAVLVPSPDREARAVTVEWLSPVESLLEIQRYPRVYEWHDLEIRRRLFEAIGELVEQVPVGRVVVPWGPPWPRGVGAAIATAVADRSGPQSDR